MAELIIFLEVRVALKILVNIVAKHLLKVSIILDFIGVSQLLLCAHLGTGCMLPTGSTERNLAITAN